MMRYSVLNAAPPNFFTLMKPTSLALTLTDLQTHLEKTASEIGAPLMLAANISGEVLAAATETRMTNEHSLAALGAGQLAATREMLRMADLADDDTQAQLLMIEGAHGSLLLCGTGELIFLAVLGKNSLLGLARMELRRLAELPWQLAEPTDASAVAQLAQEFLDSLDAEW